MPTDPTPPDTQRLAWQGWSLKIPAEWNPVKIDGDYDEGSVLLADLQAPRVGLRWKRAGRRGDATAAVAKALRDEVGKLAADEAVGWDAMDGSAWDVCRLYTDPDPPGRDVWVGHSRHSGRLLEIVYHVAERDRVLAKKLLPTLADTPRNTPTAWAVFDLNFITRPGTRVQAERFNAGDLAVLLGRPRHRGQFTVLRQVGPATLALSRQSLQDWMKRQPFTTPRHYRALQDVRPTTVHLDGRTIEGLRGTLHRKRRLWWAWFVAPQQTVVALHDTRRDRITLGQSDDETRLWEVLRTVGIL